MPDAAGAGLGGVVTVQAERIELAPGSRIDVSGLLGGGVATIGSISAPSAAAPAADEAVLPSAPKTQSLMAAVTSSVEADAIERGDGGRIQFLSDGSADFGGLRARVAGHPWAVAALSRSRAAAACRSMAWWTPPLPRASWAPCSSTRTA